MDALAVLQLVHGGLVPSYVREAMRRANEERPGTCHIELPEDVARELVCSETLSSRDGPT